MAYLLVFAELVFSGKPAPCLCVAGVAASSETYVDFWIEEQISKNWIRYSGHSERLRSFDIHVPLSLLATYSHSASVRYESHSLTFPFGLWLVSIRRHTWASFRRFSKELQTE